MRNRRRNSASAESFWHFLAWSLYLSGSIGYLMADGLLVVGLVVPPGLYLFLALLFLVDAGAYGIVWYLGARNSDGGTPLVLGVDAWAELVNIWASLFLVMAAVMDVIPRLASHSVLHAHSVTLITRGVYFCSTATYCLDAFMYNSAWHAWRVTDTSRGEIRWYKDLTLWAELFNTLPSLGYLATGILSLFGHLYMVEMDTSTAVYAASLEIVLLSRQINIAFDIMYIVDALLFAQNGPEAPPITLASAPSVSQKMSQTDYGEL